MKEQRYQVWLKGDDSPIATFRYHEDADNWRYVHCKFGEIREVGPPLPTLEDVQAAYRKDFAS